MTDDDALTVPALVEYCQVQAGLLAGTVETLTAELDDLLDELDEEMAEIRTRLDDLSDATAETVGPPSTTGPNGDAVDVDTLEDVEDAVAEKQALAEAKHARITAFQELAADYTDLAAALQADVDDGQTALERVVRFEVEHDAPAYFPDRRTVAEAAADSGEDD